MRRGEADREIEGGLEVAGNRALLQDYLWHLKEGGLRVSLFVDPVTPQIEAAKEVGAEWVELHTGAYADAPSRAEATRLFQELLNAARHARSLGLKVKCGHGLNYRNIRPDWILVDDLYDELVRTRPTVEWGGERYPSLANAKDAANVVLHLAPETNGESRVTGLRAGRRLER